MSRKQALMAHIGIQIAACLLVYPFLVNFLFKMYCWIFLGIGFDFEPVYISFFFGIAGVIIVGVAHAATVVSTAIELTSKSRG